MARPARCGASDDLNFKHRNLKMKKMPLLLAAGLLVAATSHAEDEGVAFEGNLTLASDYSFRGWSQTQRDPAIQAGLDLAFPNGFYVGTWGSNVNFGANADGDVASMEWDLYAGWATDLADGVSLDVGFIHFEYPGNREDLNYQELAVSLSFADFTVGMNYSPEYLAVADVSFYYPYADYSVELGESATLDLHLGLNYANSPGGDFFGAEQGDDYIDYSATVSFPILGATLAIGLYGTDNDDCGRDCEIRPIVSLSL